MRKKKKKKENVKKPAIGEQFIPWRRRVKVRDNNPARVSVEKSIRWKAHYRAVNKPGRGRFQRFEPKCGRTRRVPWRQ